MLKCSEIEMGNAEKDEEIGGRANTPTRRTMLSKGIQVTNISTD